MLVKSAGMDEPKATKAWWRRRRIWAGAAMVVLSYPLSFVPACWVLMRIAPPYSNPRSYAALRWTYRPAAAALKACPEPVRNAVRRAVDWGAPDGMSLSVRSKIGITKVVPVELAGVDSETLLVW